MIPANSSTSNFELFLRKYALPVIGITTAILVVFGILFEKFIISSSSLSGSFKVNRVIQSTCSSEIAVIGSSRAQGSYIPDSIAEKAFNYGIDGTGMNVHLFFLEELLRKPSAAPIILNIDMDGFFASDGDLSNYLYNVDHVQSANFLKSKLETFRKVPILKYYGYFDQYGKYFLNERLGLTKISNNGGSFEINNISESAFHAAVTKRLQEPAQFYGDKALQLKLEHLLSIAKNRKIFLVLAPYHSSYTSTFINKEDFYSYFRGLERFRNVKFIDCSGMQLDNSCFFNTTHLSLKGAEKFSTHLREILAAY